LNFELSNTENYDSLLRINNKEKLVGFVQTNSPLFLRERKKKKKERKKKKEEENKKD